MAKRTEAELLADIAKPAAIALLHKKCDQMLAQLAAEYPAREVDTWAVQLKEAEAYMLNPSAPTPFIDAAKKDSESKNSYASLIIANNAAYSAYAGNIVKIRRDFESAIANALNKAQFEPVLAQIEAL